MNKKEKILINGMMPKEIKQNPAYDKTHKNQIENIELFILMYGTKDLEEVLNTVFVAHNIKKIKIELNYKMGKMMGINPIK